MVRYGIRSWLDMARSSAEIVFGLGLDIGKDLSWFGFGLSKWLVRAIGNGWI